MVDKKNILNGLLAVLSITGFLFLNRYTNEYDCQEYADRYRKDSFNFRIEKREKKIGDRSYVLTGRDSLGNMESWKDNGDWIMHHLDFFEIGSYIYKTKGKSIVIRKYLYGKEDTLRFRCKSEWIE